ncbi:MAG: tetratricopeptide repeat protein [Myxococcales bacterium]|nr:tetratricopeptide repeat protein [Myxococcales bacterium]
MAVDRSKVLKAAQKHLAKGHLDRAITEYERLVADDPGDARLLLKLGDAYTKNGQQKQAADTYRKVADQYAEQGFFLKAVAVFKQILKLDPSRLDAWEKLAEMYELLSLVSDALSTYEKVADAYTQAGKTTRALDAMGKMAQLDPDNVAATIKYAEALSKVHRKQEASEAFLRGAAILRRQGRIDDYIKVGERLLFHQPQHLDMARDLAALYLDRKDAKHALVKLQTCFKADPHDVDTLQMLAAAFELIGQVDKALSVYREMSRILAEAGDTARQVATLQRLLALDPEHAEARRWLAQLGVSPEDPATTEESVPIIDLSDEELEDDEDVIVLEDDDSGVVPLGDDSDQSGARNLPVDDGQGSAAPLPAQQPGDGQDLQAQVEQMMEECEVFERYQLHDKMETQLRAVISLMPSHVGARVKLAEHYTRLGETAQAAAQYDEAARTPGLAPNYAQQFLQRAAELDPGTSDIARVDRAPTGATAMPGPMHGSPQVHFESDVGPDADAEEVIFLDDEENDDLVLDEEPLDTRGAWNEEAALARDEAPTAQVSRAGIASTPEPDEELIFEEPLAPVQAAPASDPEASFFGETGNLGSAEVPAPGSVARDGMTDASLFVDDEQLGFELEDRPGTDEDVRPVEPDAGPEMIVEAASEADAELIAAAETEAVRRQSVAPDGTPISDIVPLSQPPASSAHAQGVEAEDGEVQDAIEEAEFYLQQGLRDEAIESLQDALESYPDHPALSSRLEELQSSTDADNAATSADSREEASPVGDDDQSFAFAATLAEEAASAAEVGTAPASTQLGTSAASAGQDRGTLDSEVPVSDVIEQFKAGVEKAVDREDAATHYDLGIAYVEMGLHDEAIGEFKLCLEDSSRRCQANTMIGLSYLAKGSMDEAIKHFEAALACNPSASELLELWFELGNAHELNDHQAGALDYYRRVAAQSPEFRDVATRIERLEAVATPADDEAEFDAMFDNMIIKD